MAYTVAYWPTAAGHAVTWRRLFSPKPPAPINAPSHVLDAHLANLRVATTALENAVGLIAAQLSITDARSGIVGHDRQANGG